MIIYILASFFILYLLNVAIHKLSKLYIYKKNKIEHDKNKIEHDKNSKECYDYCPNFAGQLCRRPGCPGELK